MITQQLVLGRVYRFKFKSEFVNHGAGGNPCLHKGEGVFRLEQIASFEDIAKSGVKLFENFFEPLGYTRDEYTAYFDGRPEDVYEPEMTTTEVEVPVVKYVNETQVIDGVEVVVPVRQEVTETRYEKTPTGNSELVKQYLEDVSYANYPIYKLVDIVDEKDVLYVPQQTIATFPEVDINQYVDITLAIRLGLFDDATMLEPMLQAIKDKLALYGVYSSDINMIVTDEKWMSKSEYEEIVAKRLPGTRTIITNDNKEKYRGSVVIEHGEILLLKSPYFITGDTKFREEKIYYRINTSTGGYDVASVTPGETVPSNTYFEKSTDSIVDIDSVAEHAVTIDKNSPEEFIGFKFRYIPTDSHIAEIVTIDADNIEQYDTMQGTLYKEVYVVKDNVSDRNFFYLYEMERRKNAKLQAQINALEEILSANAVYKNT